MEIDQYDEDDSIIIEEELIKILNKNKKLLFKEKVKEYLESQWALDSIDALSNLDSNV